MTRSSCRATSPGTRPRTSPTPSRARACPAHRLGRFGTPTAGVSVVLCTAHLAVARDPVHRTGFAEYTDRMLALLGHAAQARAFGHRRPSLGARARGAAPGRASSRRARRVRARGAPPRAPGPRRPRTRSATSSATAPAVAGSQSRPSASYTGIRMSRTRSRLAHHDHAADVPGALDQALADAGQLGLPAGVDACTRRGSTRARTSPTRASTPRCRSARSTMPGDVAEAVVRARPRVLRAAGPRERDRVLVEDGGAPAGEPLDRLEATGARGMRRVGVAGAREVELAERHHRDRAAPGETSPAAHHAQHARGSRARRRCRRHGRSGKAVRTSWMYSVSREELERAVVHQLRPLLGDEVAGVGDELDREVVRELLRVAVEERLRDREVVSRRRGASSGR